MRARVAPSDTRMSTSRERRAARANTRLAALAQAMRSTMKEAAISAVSTDRVTALSAYWSWNAPTHDRNPAFVSG